MRRPSAGQIVLALAGGAALAFALWKVAVALRSDETRVRLVLEAVAREARARDPGGVLRYLDTDYRDSRGVTYLEASRIVTAYLMRADSVELELEPLSPVSVEGDTARVRVRAELSLALGGKTLSFNDAGLRGDLFDLTLRRHESYFRCVRLEEAEGGAPGEEATQ
jgi:hypothetical protein